MKENIYKAFSEVDTILEYTRRYKYIDSSF